MKRICLLLLFSVFAISFLPSCDRQEKGYLSHTIEQKARMQKIVLLKQAQDSLQMYKVQNNKWPSSLDEVSNFPELPQDQKWEWIYDSSNGKIEIGKKEN